MRDRNSPSRPSSHLRRLLAQDEILVAPGVYDGLSARLVAQAGFPVAYASGGAIARSRGIPDMGLLSLSEVAQRLSEIVDAVEVPVIADADTGYGNALNVRRAVREFERAGVAGLHLEDQTFPKRCGHLDDKSVVSTEEMVGKLVAAREARTDPDLVIIARTDAVAVEGFDGALRRAEAYAKAGADLLFVEAPTDIEQIERIAKLAPCPLLINMFKGGKTPLVPLDVLRRWGYRLVIIPSDLQRAAIAAMQDVLTEIGAHGNSETYTGRMISFADREVVVDTATYIAWSKRYEA